MLVIFKTSQRLIVCVQLNGFKYNKLSNRFILLLPGARNGINTPDENRYGSNGNEKVLHIPLNSCPVVSPSDDLVS